MRATITRCLSAIAILGFANQSVAAERHADSDASRSQTTANQLRHQVALSPHQSPGKAEKRGVANGGCIPAPNLHIADAWIRQPPPGARMLAGYITFQNTTSRNLALTSATCDAFEEVQIHTITRDQVSGMVRMVRLKELVIPANQTLVMAPGHDHLMLIGPKRDILAGEKLTLRLFFSDGTLKECYPDVRGRAKSAN